jgi:hypothetical protein
MVRGDAIRNSGQDPASIPLFVKPAGSGNILMEPNDQYLCIVAGRKDRDVNTIMLPFEGDQLLSIILSKATLLAADNKITDRTIRSQITRR